MVIGVAAAARWCMRHVLPTDGSRRLVTTPDPETGELLDAETVRDQILMHLSNGFNGPSITGAWLAYVLATRPDVEEKLIARSTGSPAATRTTTCTTTT
jgi:cytochrome P450